MNVHAQTGVEVVLPRHAPERAAELALAELRPWIERRLAEIARVRRELAARAGTVPYLGVALTLQPQPGRQVVHRDGDRLLVPAGEAMRPALERFYRRAARVEIAERLDAATARAGTAYTGLAIRAQRSRWASCSASGGMSFNWRLLMAPEPVLEYVVWHEVCHLQIRDHSPRFWALVARYRPTFRAEREWLRRNGATLVL